MAQWANAKLWKPAKCRDECGIRQATAGQNYANNTGQLLQGLGAIRAGQAQQPSSLARGIGGAASGALAGAQLGSVVPGIGNVAGAIGGGLIGLVGGLGF